MRRAAAAGSILRRVLQAELEDPVHHGAKDGRGRPIHSGLVRVAAARLGLEAVLVRGGPLSEGLRTPTSNPLKPMATRARLRGIEPVRRDPQTVIDGHDGGPLLAPRPPQRGQRGLQTTQGVVVVGSEAPQGHER